MKEYLPLQEFLQGHSPLLIELLGDPFNSGFNAILIISPYDKGMEKREYERISADVRVYFIYNNAMCSGKIKNLSKNGMYVETETCLPLQSRIDALISMINVKDDYFKVPVKVARADRKSTIHHGAGVMLLKRPQHYIKLLESLRSP